MSELSQNASGMIDGLVGLGYPGILPNPNYYQSGGTVSQTELFNALIAAQGEFTAATADTENTFFKSQYADLAAVKAVAQPVLLKNGLGVIQEPGFQVIDGKIHDILKTTLIHTSGQSRESTMILRPVKGDPQAQGSAITYAKRYAFMAILGLVADADDDGNAASGAKAPAKSRAAAKPAPADEDQAALNAANSALKAAAKAAGVSPPDVVAYVQETFNENLTSTRNVDVLNKATEHFNTEAAKKALGATEAPAS